MATKTKKQLITKIASQTNHHPNEVRLIVQSFLDSITDCLSEGNRLEFRDFGVFEVVTRKQKNRKKSKECFCCYCNPRKTSG